MHLHHILCQVLISFISGILVFIFVSFVEAMGNSCSSSLIDLSWSGFGTILLILVVICAGAYFYSTRVRRITKRNLYRKNGFDLELYSEFEAYRREQSHRRSPFPAVTYETNNEHRPAFNLHSGSIASSSRPAQPSVPSPTPSPDDLLQILSQLVADRLPNPSPPPTSPTPVHIADQAARRSQWNNVI